MNVKLRLWLAWVLLVASLIGWPLSAFTFAKGEPPVVLGLSWLAITLTATDILVSTDVRATQEEPNGQAEESDGS